MAFGRRSAIAALLVLILFALFTGPALTGWILSRPMQTQIGPPPPDLGARDVTFASTSGTTIHGWLCEVPNAHGYVLLLPGVRANRLSMVSRARFLRAAGYSALLIDLQATGESRGQRITFGYLESRDAAAAVAQLRSIAHDKPVMVLGTSLGGAAAILANPPLDIDGAVLEEVYPSIEAAIENRLRRRFGPLGALGKPILLHQLRSQLGIDPSVLQPASRIDNLRCPLLIIGGGADRSTTPAETQRLFAAAREPKQLWMVPGANHFDLHRFAKADYERRVAGFMNAATASASASPSSRAMTAAARSHPLPSPPPHPREDTAAPAP